MIGRVLCDGKLRKEIFCFCVGLITLDPLNGLKKNGDMHCRTKE